MTVSINSTTICNGTAPCIRKKNSLCIAEKYKALKAAGQSSGNKKKKTADKNTDPLSASHNNDSNSSDEENQLLQITFNTVQSQKFIKSTEENQQKLCEN